jgi:hypothetical protein
MMQAGKYYVGDLCYVMTDAEWDEFCSITIDGSRCLDGEFQFKDGRRFATYGTMYGDGSYSDQYGNDYGVDAGLIGCIRIGDISGEKLDGIELGAVHEFGTDFVTGGGRGEKFWAGTIQFGRVAIETGDSNSYDEDEDDETDCFDE